MEGLREGMTGEGGIEVGKEGGWDGERVEGTEG